MLLVWSWFSKHCYSSSCEYVHTVSRIAAPRANMSNYKNKQILQKPVGCAIWFQNSMEVRLAHDHCFATR